MPQPNHDLEPSSFNDHTARHAFRHYANDFYDAYRKHRGGSKFSPARLFLLSRSIELAAKALQLAKGQTSKRLAKIGHDLEKACDQVTLAEFGMSLSPADREELRKANEYYRGKGFEYFIFKFGGIDDIDRSGPQLALSGWPNLPNEQALESLFEKLIAPKI